MQYQGGKHFSAKDIASIISATGGVKPYLRYQGGKTKSAIQIADRIENTSDVFVSLFCGALNVESKVKGFNRIICNDNQKYLIELFKALQNGYVLPDTITQDQYYYIKDHKDEDPALTAFVGFGCSFGGKWFGGYARNNSKRNYASEAKRGLAKKMATLQNAEFICMDYRDVELPDGCVVYADPPYEGTTSYAGNAFDSNAFWDYMREISKNHKVYISELEAPDDFKCIWQKDVRRSLDVNTENRFLSTEKLFTIKD